MVMALSLFYQGQSLTLVAGYENGLATVAQLDDGGNWTVKYQAKCHSQPVLSLDVSPSRDFFLTSSADAIIAKHPLPRGPERSKEAESAQADGDRDSSEEKHPAAPPAGTSLLSAALAGEARATPAQAPTASSPPDVQTEPLATVNTKHAGQQSLRIRSDGRVFATAGWDSRVRVYSTKTLKEVAVLKWHQVGCYAAAFAVVEPAPDGGGDRAAGTGEAAAGGEVSSRHSSDRQVVRGGSNSSLATVPKLVELTVREKRIRQARTAHWLAAGSKDGKVSLWDVF